MPTADDEQSTRMMAPCRGTARAAGQDEGRQGACIRCALARRQLVELTLESDFCSCTAHIPECCAERRTAAQSSAAQRAVSAVGLNHFIGCCVGHARAGMLVHCSYRWLQGCSLHRT